MKKSSLSLTLSALLVSGLLFSAGVIAHSGGSPNDAYVGDKRNHLVVPRSGGCVRTGSWTKDKTLAGCGLTIVLQASALFDFDKADIKPAARSELNALAANIKATGDVERISIVGHTDSMGSDAYNQDLSMRRARAVKNYLVGKGISSGMISTSGMGESQPVASNDTAEGRAMNRRVEINIGSDD